MADKIITVVGATGTQGASVVDVFLQTPGWKVRGITRDPSKPAGQALKERGVETVAADLDNLDGLKTAFKGSAVIFGVTDFWQFMSMPATQETATATGKTLNEVAYDREVQQGKNIVDAAAATVDSLERFVLSTLTPSRELSNGSITWNYHFDAKWAAVEYLKKTYPELAKKTSYFQAGFFATNFEGPLLRKNEDGTYVLASPVKPDASVPLLYTRKDTGSFVRGLVQAPAGTNLLAFGEMMSLADFASLWGKLMGKTINYTQLPQGAMANMMPGGIGKELEDMFTYISEYGYDGNQPGIVYPKELGVPVQQTTMEQYIGDTDWSSKM